MDSSSRPIETTWIPLERLDPNPWNPNVMDREKREKLAAEMRAGGCVAPLLVRPQGGRYQIVDGEHRYRIARELELEALPCVVLEFDDLEAMIKTLQLNGFRGENDPDKLAALLIELEGRKAVSELAPRLPWSELEVEQMIALAELEAGVLETEIRARTLEPASIVAPELELFAVVVDRAQKQAIDRALGLELERGGHRNQAEALAAICRARIETAGQGR